MAELQMLAADYGASSGRVILGNYDGRRLKLSEIHRFSNDPVILGKKNGSVMYWDFPRLFHELKNGILKSKACGTPVSIGVDTWGVDYGLLDADGCLLSNPIHYRDGRTEGMLQEAFTQIDRERFYEITGNQFMEINTVFQLMADVRKRPGLLKLAERMLLMPDLFHYFLSGEVTAEYTEASTTQMLDAKKKCWSGEILESLKLPGQLLPEIVMPGTMLGKLRPELEEELGISNLKVAAVAGHDTQSAMAAVPADTENFIFLSCGTWSLFGTELDAPVISDASCRYNVTNEGGCCGKTSFLKNIIGLWLIQESKRQWGREGRAYDFGQLEAMAAKETPFLAVIDPDAPEFVPSGNVPERIREYCRKTHQPVPESVGAIVRCINESLALKYRGVLEEIQSCTGKSYEAVHLVGGGAKSALLCQMTANACGIPVYAGPVEATVYGNLSMQLMAAGEVKNLREIRRIVKDSEEIKVYLPQDTDAWQTAWEKSKKILG
ncbi:MAG: rhamnulokinase [Fusicatenibacter sp.]|nr:rhamnulokinase [Fusicatenibacter sp.]